MRGVRAGLISGGVKCEAGRLLACDCARSVGSMGGETTEEVTSGARVEEIAKLPRAWVKVDVVGAETVDTRVLAAGNCVGLAWLDETVEVWVTIGLSNLTPLRTTGAMILQTGSHQVSN